MGNFCACKVFLHQKDEANMDEMKGTDGVNSNRPIEIISQYSQLSSMNKEKLLGKADKIKNNLEKKLPEIGTYISENEFKSLINDNINEYMEKNKLNFQKYISPNISTFAANPIKFKNNNVYLGNWNINTEMEGYGMYYLTDNQGPVITEGIWNRGNIVFGRIFLSNGNIYEGEIKNSVPDGKGKITFSNGDIYKGDFKFGEMNGKGVFTFNDKAEYNGNIENGLFNGKGRLKWENGTEYEGNFANSTLSGSGIISNVQGEKYKGMFDKNEFNGEGIYYFRNGDEYEGTFEYGIKRGKGIYRRSDNVTFEGFWNDDLPNGNGELSYLGNKIKGFWRNGAFVGNPEIEMGSLESFNGIDKNIKPYKISIFPSSLSHLAITDSNTSQFIAGNLNFD